MCRVTVAITEMTFKAATPDDKVETISLTLMGAYRSERYRRKAAKRHLERIEGNYTYIGEVDHVIKETTYRLTRQAIISNGTKINEKETRND